jgi:hypothetical protein
VICTTGFARVAASEREMLHGPVLPKPYRPNTLLREVERSLA